MGIEPTFERLHARTPDLKSGSPTSELGASNAPNVLNAMVFGKPFWRPVVLPEKTEDSLQLTIGWAGTQKRACSRT